MLDQLNKSKVALVHEWLVDYSGSEKVVEQILNLFPTADLFAQVEFLPDDLKFFIKNKPVQTSLVQKLPFAKSKYRNYLPLMPFAVEQFDLSEYDFIISSNHAVSKGVITNSNQVHISYCHSPIRYAWDLYHQYIKESGLDKGLKGLIAKAILHYIRNWDYSAAQRVDYYIANSKYIAKRIEKVYRRPARVVYPPVNTDAFQLGEKKDDFYMTASRLVPYKKVNLIIEAFTKMTDKKLVVIGDGPDMEKIKKDATSNIEILGFQESNVLIDHMKRAKAFVFAAEEDFGITPVESQACGTPVIAFGKGGCLETVVDGKTGLFFAEQTPDSIVEAVSRFDKVSDTLLNPSEIREHALGFSEESFRTNFANTVAEIMANHQD